MKIDIIGRGNVGTHLANAFEGMADAVSVNPRTLAELRADSDIYIISVSDDAIGGVAKALKARLPREAILAHTSGTTPMSRLKGCARNIGVFYPLQTFSKNVGLNYREIPFFIEGSDKKVEKQLCETARLVSDSVTLADSEKRKDLHVASVFSCNFVNHLWTMADDYLAERGLDFKSLLPLIRETTRKIERLHPADGQTGPAVRHDHKTLESHMHRLEMHPELQEIYSLLSLSIMSRHPKGDSKK